MLMCVFAFWRVDRAGEGLNECPIRWSADAVAAAVRTQLCMQDMQLKEHVQLNERAVETTDCWKTCLVGTCRWRRLLRCAAVRVCVVQRYRRVALYAVRCAFVCVGDPHRVWAFCVCV